MYKTVRTQEELDMYHQIKKSAWDEKGFEMEYVRKGTDAILFYGQDGLPGGTFEATPYSEFTRDSIKELFDSFLEEGMKTVEIDGFAVLPQYRGKLGREIVCFIIHYAQMNGFTHAVAISDPSVLRSFNNTYHIPSYLTLEKMWYKGDYVIPVIFDLKEVYDNLEDEKYAWFTRPVEMEEEVA